MQVVRQLLRLLIKEQMIRQGQGHLGHLQITIYNITMVEQDMVVGIEKLNTLRDIYIHQQY